MNHRSVAASSSFSLCCWLASLQNVEFDDAFPNFQFLDPQEQIVIKVKFGVEEQTIGSPLHAKFFLDRFVDVDVGLM